MRNNEDGVTHLADLVDLIIRARRLSAAVEGKNTMVSSTMATTTIKSTQYIYTYYLEKRGKGNKRGWAPLLCGVVRNEENKRAKYVPQIHRNLFLRSY